MEINDHSLRLQVERREPEYPANAPVLSPRQLGDYNFPPGCLYVPEHRFGDAQAGQHLNKAMGRAIERTQGVIGLLDLQGVSTAGDFILEPTEEVGDTTRLYAGVASDTARGVDLNHWLVTESCLKPAVRPGVLTFVFEAGVADLTPVYVTTVSKKQFRLAGPTCPAELIESEEEVVSFDFAENLTLDEMEKIRRSMHTIAQAIRSSKVRGRVQLQLSLPYEEIILALTDARCRKLADPQMCMVSSDRAWKCLKRREKYASDLLTEMLGPDMRRLVLSTRSELRPAGQKLHGAFVEGHGHPLSELLKANCRKDELWRRLVKDWDGVVPRALRRLGESKAHLWSGPEELINVARAVALLRAPADALVVVVGDPGVVQRSIGLAEGLGPEIIGRQPAMAGLSSHRRIVGATRDAWGAFEWYRSTPWVFIRDPQQDARKQVTRVPYAGLLQRLYGVPGDGMS